MPPTNLAQALADTSPVQYLRNVQDDAYLMPVLPSDLASWYIEQRAWRESAVLFDQTHHMESTFLGGRDAERLLSETAVNSLAGFAAGRAKQYVAVSPEGFVIGDGILSRETADRYALVGRPPAQNWLRYHAEAGGYDVDVEIDPRSLQNPLGRPVVRRLWRFQLQGPLAWSIVEKLNGGPVPDLKFFHMGEMQIGSRRVTTLRHGMSGVPGLELWGPYEDYLPVRDAILAAGEEFGIVATGGRSYQTGVLESGWIPSPLPAVYSSPELEAYRAWLPADSAEGGRSLAGSFVSDDVDDYYLSPWELGYGRHISYEHDFIGRDALRTFDPAAQRERVTFEWNDDDFLAIIASTLGEEPGYKMFDIPLANYGYYNYDAVLGAGGERVGLSLWTGYTANERRALSIGVVDPSVQIGDEVRVVWGEPDQTRKRTVEPHRQFEVRATVRPAPYSREARESYRKDS